MAPVAEWWRDVNALRDFMKEWSSKLQEIEKQEIEDFLAHKEREEGEKKAEDQQKTPAHVPPAVAVAVSAPSEAQQKPGEEEAPKQEQEIEDFLAHKEREEGEKKAEDQQKTPAHVPPAVAVAVSAPSEAQEKPGEEEPPKQEQEIEDFLAHKEREEGEKKAEDQQKTPAHVPPAVAVAVSAPSEAQQKPGEEEAPKQEQEIEDFLAHNERKEGEKKAEDQQKTPAHVPPAVAVAVSAPSEAQQKPGEEEPPKQEQEIEDFLAHKEREEGEKKAEDQQETPAHVPPAVALAVSAPSQAQQKPGEEAHKEREEGEKKGEGQQKTPVHVPPAVAVAVPAPSQAQQKPGEEAAPKQEKPPMDAAAVRAAAQKAADVLSQLLPKPLEYEVREALPCYSEPDTSSKQLRMLDVGELLQGYPGGGWVRLQAGKGWAHIGRSLALTCLLPTVRARYLEAMDLSWQGFPKVKPGVKAGP